MITNSTRITLNTYSTLNFILSHPFLVLKRGSHVKGQWHDCLACGANIIVECALNKSVGPVWPVLAL